MVQLEAVRVAVGPLVAGLGLELVDVEVVGSGRARTLRVTVDREGGVDLDGITAATEVVSRAVDGLEVFGGTFTLEVSSPGIERALRTPDEFRRSAGTTISLKTHEPVLGGRRHRGTLLAADDEGIVLKTDGTTLRLRYDEVSQARTVFEWRGAAKPGKAAPGGRPKEKRRA